MLRTELYLFDRRGKDFSQMILSNVNPVPLEKLEEDLDFSQMRRDIFVKKGKTQEFTSFFNSHYVKFVNYLQHDDIDYESLLNQIENFIFLVKDIDLDSDKKK